MISLGMSVWMLMATIGAVMPITWLEEGVSPVGNTRMESYDLPRFSQGLMLVEQEGSYGFVNQQGKLVIPPVYLDGGAFGSGLAPVAMETTGSVGDQWLFQQLELEVSQENNELVTRYGFVSQGGQMVIAPVFTHAYSFSEDLAAVLLPTGFWGFVDTRGNLAIYQDYLWVGDFSGGYAVVQTGAGFGVIDCYGREVVPPSFTDIIGTGSLYFVSRGAGYALLDVAGRMYTNFIYEDPSPFVDGLALVEWEGKRVYLNEIGSVVISGDYTQGFSFQESLAWVRKEGAYQFIDTSGTPYLTNLSSYSQVMSFSEGYARVKSGIYYGFVNKEGEAVLPTIYRDGIPVSEGVGLVYDGTRWGLFSRVWQDATWSIPYLDQGEALGLAVDAYYGNDLGRGMTRGEFTELILRCYDLLSVSVADEPEEEEALEEELEDSDKDKDDQEDEEDEAVTEIPEMPVFIPTIYTAPFADTSSLVINRAYSLNLAGGESAGFYGAYQSLTREQAATLMATLYCRLSGEELPETSTDLFADHSEISFWAAPSVYFLSSYNVVGGTGDNLYAPQDDVTLQEAMVMAVAFVENLGVLL